MMCHNNDHCLMKPIIDLSLHATWYGQVFFTIDNDHVWNFLSFSLFLKNCLHNIPLSVILGLFRLKDNSVFRYK